MNFTISKTLEYLLSTTIFSLAECNRLIKPVYNLVILRCRICHKILLSIQYGLKEVIGLGLKNLFYNQRIKKLVIFLEGRISNSLASSLLRANYKTAFLHLGVGRYSLLRADFSKFNNLLPRS